eukprot:GHVT01041059.1.p1 GENE.GHVT01041059.1~~GHVT01041059.1.p1  ORF type:complete len:115 (-),score=14.63 GHVT01041059.1:293-637(-)
MWESERQRVTLKSATLFKRWGPEHMPELYQTSVRWALNRGFCLFHTPWPDDSTTGAFAAWERGEKHLVVPDNYSNQVVAKIRELRAAIIQQKQQELRQANPQTNPTTNRATAFT